jgi:hypothetical protein
MDHSHTVIALDLSSIPTRGAADALLVALDSAGDSPLVSVSSFAGVEGWIAAALENGSVSSDALGDTVYGFDGPAIISRLRSDHRALAESLSASAAAEEAALLKIDRILGGLWTLVACPAVGGSRRLRSLAVGEKLAAACACLALASLGRPSPLLDPVELGLTDPAAAARIIPARLSGLPGAVVPGLRSAWPIAAALGQGEPELRVLEAGESRGSNRGESREAVPDRGFRAATREAVAFAPTVA